MKEITTLALYVEGFTRSPLDAVFVADTEVHPEEMAELVDELFRNLREHDGAVSLAAVINSLDEFRAQQSLPTTEPHHQYLVPLIKEEMPEDDDGIQMGYRTDNDDFEFRAIIDWMDSS